MAVLKLLSSQVFEPLEKLTLREFTKVLFLVSLATAKRIGEIQAVSRKISYADKDIFLSYLPEFRAKSESEGSPLPRAFKVTSLEDFIAGEESEMLLCPVRALKHYLSCIYRAPISYDRTLELSSSPRETHLSHYLRMRLVSSLENLSCKLAIAIPSDRQVIIPGPEHIYQEYGNIGSIP